MARGGTRPGAGRKKGTGKEQTITAVRKSVAERVIMGDITPLEVMIKAMRAADQEGDARNAAFYANMAAPYVHPKLSSVNANLSGEVKATLQVVSEFPDADDVADLTG
jgi:hypothetical protein